MIPINNMNRTSKEPIPNRFKKIRHITYKKLNTHPLYIRNPFKILKQTILTPRK